MKLTVNVKSELLGSHLYKYQISPEENLGKLIQLVILDQKFLSHEAGRLKYGDYMFSEFQKLKLGNMFHGTNEITIKSETVELLIQNNPVETKDTDLLLFDYTQFIKASDVYNDLLKKIEVKDGTVFYIQQEKEQYLIRKEAHHLEFYHFKRQFNDAFSEDTRLPFFIVEFKKRAALTVSENHFIKKYRYPKTDYLNPIIHLELAKLSQSVIDEIALLIHRLFTILGRFVNAHVTLSDDSKIPSYIQVNHEETIGFVEYSDLENLKLKED